MSQMQIGEADRKEKICYRYDEQPATISTNWFGFVSFFLASRHGKWKTHVRKSRIYCYL